MRQSPSADLAAVLRNAARTPDGRSRAETAVLLAQAAEEIEVLRLALADAMTRNNADLLSELRLNKTG